MPPLLPLTSAVSSSSPLCVGVVQTQEAFTGLCGVMDQREEDSVVLDDPQQEVEQQPSDQPVLHAGSPDQMEDNGEERDTDLETDGRLR